MRILFCFALLCTTIWLFFVFQVAANSSRNFAEFRTVLSLTQKTEDIASSQSNKGKLASNKPSIAKQQDSETSKKPDGLHEWGDFLSGTFAPISFLWVVLAFMSQSKQLKVASTALLAQQVEQIRAAKISAMTALVSHEWSQNAVFNQIQESYFRSGDSQKSTLYREKAIAAGERARNHAAELRKILNLPDPE
jgi:hypothetical protein